MADEWLVGNAWAMALHWTLSALIVVAGSFVAYLRSGQRVRHGVGFFHPFTSDGGGGERVLWCAIREVQTAHPLARCFVYSGDEATGAELALRAERRFGIKLVRPIEVVRLTRRALVVPERYPVLTMVGQAVGSAILTAEAVTARRPEVFFDTVGYAFGYPVARLAGAKVAAYVHYPTISADMIGRVKSRANMYNNAGAVARSRALTALKVWYYRAFALAYGACGRCASAVAVNSTWTQGHVRALWGGDPEVVYPPCDTAALRDLPLDRGAGTNLESREGQRKRRDDKREDAHEDDAGAYVLSVGQFRPEKDHALQLRAWAAARGVDAGKKEKNAEAEGVLKARLKIVGGCRGPADEARLEALRALAVELGVDDSVDFHVDVPYPRLQQLLAGAAAGLHTMLDEHFGICVVEFMAAGAVPIAHDSAGPKLDIVRPANDDDGAVGYLATTDEEFAASMTKVLGMTAVERDAMARRARKRSEMFSEEAFGIGLRRALSPVLTAAS